MTLTCELDLVTVKIKQRAERKRSKVIYFKNLLPDTPQTSLHSYPLTQALYKVPDSDLCATLLTHHIGPIRLTANNFLVIVARASKFSGIIHVLALLGY